MTKTAVKLSRHIAEDCQSCSVPECRSIVAYCCHLVFTDKSIRRQEVDTLRAIADALEVTPHEVAKMARKARRGRLKIKKPKSDASRRLLF